MGKQVPSEKINLVLKGKLITGQSYQVSENSVDLTTIPCGV